MVVRSFRSLLAIIVSFAILSVTYAPKASAEQGYAWLEFDVSKTHVAVGEEFSVAVYIIGRDNTPYGKATLSIESWYPGDPNPKAYEFVRFDDSDSDFSIDNGQSITPGQYNYQCRSVDRSASADMTGRHLFGRYVYRALNPGTHAFSPSLGCRTVLESLSGNWGIIWDYSTDEITIDKPVQPAPTNPGSASSSPTGPNTQSSAKKTTDSTADTPAAAVQGVQTVATTQTVQEKQPAKKANSKLVAAKQQLNKGWVLLALLPIILLPLAIWKLRKLRTPADC